MRRWRYYWSRLRRMNFGNMVREAREIGCKIGRPWWVIYLDMIYCSLVYQAGYSDYYEYEFYRMRRAQRRTYITVGINDKLVKRFNQRDYCHWLDNKADFNERFARYIRRDFLNLYTASQDDFSAFVAKHPRFIAKPQCDYAGRGVELVDFSAYPDLYTLRQRLMAKNQFLVEERIVQHPAMSALYPGSVNTVRLITFFDGADVHLLRAVLKAGNGKVTDNFSAGGMYAILDDRGVGQTSAIDKNGLTYERHPLTGVRFPGFRVPLFSEALRMVAQASREIPQVQYIGWDVAITPDGPVVVEANQSSGAFQPKASLCSGLICGDLPTYKLYMKF